MNFIMGRTLVEIVFKILGLMLVLMAVALILGCIFLAYVIISWKQMEKDEMLEEQRDNEMEGDD